MMQIEAVENHMPEVVIVDEIGTEAEALACRTIAERGVVLIGTAHGCFLENLIKNPTLSDLVGGVTSVTLGDEEARTRGTQKSVLERKGPPTFPIVIEMRDRGAWVAHDTAQSVDALLVNKVPKVQVSQGRQWHSGIDPVTSRVKLHLHLGMWKISDAFDFDLRCSVLLAAMSAWKPLVAATSLAAPRFAVCWSQVVISCT
jgi:hypothetical protein